MDVFFNVYGRGYLPHTKCTTHLHINYGKINEYYENYTNSRVGTEMDHNLDSFIGDYGYIGIILALAGGIVGFPIPDELLLTFIGYCVSQGRLTYGIALACSFIGSITGITVSYWIGLKLGLPFIKKYGPIMYITEERFELARRLFHRWGVLMLFFGYFIPGIRQVSAIIGAISQISFRKFVLYAYSGGLVWSITFITLGQILGKSWTKVEQYIDEILLYTIGLFFIAGFIIFTTRLILFRGEKAKIE
jgi:membrane protein DedA with SNARE-associated domain